MLGHVNPWGGFGFGRYLKDGIYPWKGVGRWVEVPNDSNADRAENALWVHLSHPYI